MKIIPIILLLSSIVTPLELNKHKVVLAIDCGSYSGWDSENGFRYQKDDYYSDSKVADYSVNNEKNGVSIRYTDDSMVYFTERHQDFSFNYRLPLTTGKYVVILQFSELYFEQSGRRQFNIKVGDRKVAERVDIVKEVGKNSAYDHYIEIEIANNKVYWKGLECHNSYQDARVKVELEKIEGRDNPKIDGIVVVKGGLVDTDYYRVPQNRQKWMQKQVEKQRKLEQEAIKREAQKLKRKEKLRERYDVHDDDEQEEELIEEQQFDWNMIHTESIFGVVFIAVAIAIVIYNITTIPLTIARKKKKRN